MNRTDLIVVRHGQTTWNIEKRWQGHFDSPLTPQGERQAHLLAARLKHRRFSALYSSDLGRAYQTARIISDATGHSVVADARLRERNLGIFQALTDEEIRTAYPEEYERHRLRDPDYIVPGGESLRQQVERNISFLDQLAKNHSGQCIVVVTHGGVLNGLFRHALFIPLEAPRRFGFPNSSLNIFTYGDGEWMLQTWGDTSHLDGS
ncbi:MAG: histidine phosphatase family protein [Deltaproteobacteria bacterium]|nr:histidine phosphatase family protein [Deltaproteobacteria bacterium]